MSSRNNCQYCDFDFTSYRKKSEDKSKNYHTQSGCGIQNRRSRSPVEYKSSCKRDCCDYSHSRSHSEERKPKCEKYVSSCSEKESKSDDSISCRSLPHNKCEKYKACDDFKKKTCTKKIEGKCGNGIYITIQL